MDKILLERAKKGEWAELFREADASVPAPRKDQKKMKIEAEAKIRERVLTLVEEGQFSKACKALETHRSPRTHS